MLSIFQTCRTSFLHIPSSILPGGAWTDDNSSPSDIRLYLDDMPRPFRLVCFLFIIFRDCSPINFYLVGEEESIDRRIGSWLEPHSSLYSPTERRAGCTSNLPTWREGIGDLRASRAWLESGTLQVISAVLSYYLREPDLVRKRINATFSGCPIQGMYISSNWRGSNWDQAFKVMFWQANKDVHSAGILFALIRCQHPKCILKYPSRPVEHSLPFCSLRMIEFTKTFVSCSSKLYIYIHSE